MLSELAATAAVHHQHTACKQRFSHVADCASIGIVAERSDVALSQPVQQYALFDHGLR